jgi:hypothetical protein
MSALFTDIQKDTGDPYPSPDEVWFYFAYFNPPKWALIYSTYQAFPIALLPTSYYEPEEDIDIT